MNLVYQLNKHKKTPLHYAFENKNISINKIIDFVQQMNIDLFSPTLKEDIFHSACTNNISKSNIEFFLMKNFDLHSLYSKKSTPFQILLENNFLNFEFFEFLIFNQNVNIGQVSTLSFCRYLSCLLGSSRADEEKERLLFLFLNVFLFNFDFHDKNKIQTIYNFFLELKEINLRNITNHIQFINYIKKTYIKIFYNNIKVYCISKKQIRVFNGNYIVNQNNQIIESNGEGACVITNFHDNKAKKFNFCQIVNQKVTGFFKMKDYVGFNNYRYEGYLEDSIIKDKVILFDKKTKKEYILETNDQGVILENTKKRSFSGARIQIIGNENVGKVKKK